jgi:hypothetical protein
VIRRPAALQDEREVPAIDALMRGEYSHPQCVEQASAGDFIDALRGRHVNVSIGCRERRIESASREFRFGYVSRSWRHLLCVPAVYRSRRASHVPQRRERLEGRSVERSSRIDQLFSIVSEITPGHGEILPPALCHRAYRRCTPLPARCRHVRPGPRRDERHLQLHHSGRRWPRHGIDDASGSGRFAAVDRPVNGGSAGWHTGGVRSASRSRRRSGLRTYTGALLRRRTRRNDERRRVWDLRPGFVQPPSIHGRRH